MEFIYVTVEYKRWNWGTCWCLFHKNVESIFYNWGCMVNIIVIQEIATDEIYSGYTRGRYWFISWNLTSGFDNFQIQDITAIECPI